jgi:hypothetical protein
MISFFKYVPNGFVHVWEAAGWIATDSLIGTGHGIYSTLMKAGPNCKLKEDGEPVCASDRGGGVKLAQAVVSQTRDGQWKITAQSDKQVENMFVGSFEDVIQTLREYNRSDWEKRS